MVHFFYTFLLLIFSIASAQLQTPCYVCRTEARFITNPNQSFELTDIYGKKSSITCGELEDIGLNDLVVSNSVCGIFLNHVDKNCECGGPPIAPVGVLNENPPSSIPSDSPSLVPSLSAGPTNVPTVTITAVPTQEPTPDEDDSMPTTAEPMPEGPDGTEGLPSSSPLSYKIAMSTVFGALVSLVLAF
jgi:hypothetical protein